MGQGPSQEVKRQAIRLSSFFTFPDLFEGMERSRIRCNFTTVEITANVQILERGPGRIQFHTQTLVMHKSWIKYQVKNPG
jgi:hypothetical protein